MSDDVVGCVGRVVTRIRGGQSPGEISLLLHGTSELFMAYSDAVLERGDHVLVITSRGSRSVDVIAWDAGAPLSE